MSAEPAATRTTSVAQVSGRVLGWDALRGFCAAAVALYHLLLWLGLADGAAFGSYGVYMFFALSGASLAYTYGPAIQQGRFRFRSFLWVRYLRLAPLYAVALAISIPLIYWPGEWTLSLLTRLALNLSFSFGLDDPAQSALVVGGWSLGIEALFYLMFPVIMAGLLSKTWRIPMVVVGIAVQLAWMHHSLGGAGDYADKAVRYHQLPAFVGYFVGGCAIGLATRAGHRIRLSVPLGLALMALGFMLIGALNPSRQGDELWGWRALILAPLCLILSAIAAGMDWSPRWSRWAEPLGDATYGLYLLHPILFWGAARALQSWTDLPPVVFWSLGAKHALVAAVFLAAFVLAIASERHFERPLREWSRRRVG